LIENFAYHGFDVEGYLADKYGYYSTNATWLSAYSSGVQAEISANKWNKTQADAYVALLGTSPSVPINGLGMWLRADSGVTTDGSGNVSFWQDQTPNGNNAFQTSSSLRPPLVSDSFSGQPGISFHGDGLYLRITDSPSLRPANALTRIIAFKPRSQNPYYSAVINRPYHTDSSWSFPWVTTGLWIGPTDYLFTWLTTSAGQSTIGAVQPIDSVSGCISMEVYDGTTQSFYLNGTLNGTLTPSHPIDYNGSGPIDWVIGVSGPYAPYYNYNGDVCEILFYNRALTTTEQGQVDGYLADKYGLYDPNATWPSTYSSGVQAEITLHQWSKAQTDAYVALQSDTSGVITAGLTPLVQSRCRCDLRRQRQCQ